MPNLSVDFNALSACSASMKDVNNKLTEKLRAIETEMKAVNTEDVYFSKDAQECLEKFNRMATKRIPEFESVINEYVKFLDDAIEAYKRDIVVNIDHVENAIEPFA